MTQAAALRMLTLAQPDARHRAAVVGALRRQAADPETEQEITEAAQELEEYWLHTQPIDRKRVAPPSGPLNEAQAAAVAEDFGRSSVDQRAVIEALGRAKGNAEVAKKLAALLTDVSQRRKAKAALKRIGPEAAEAVQPMLGHESHMVQRAAKEVIAATGDEKQAAMIAEREQQEKSLRRARLDLHLKLRKTPDAMREPVEPKKLRKALKQLKAEDPIDRVSGLETLALAQPTPQFKEPVQRALTRFKADPDNRALRNVVDDVAEVWEKPAMNASAPGQGLTTRQVRSLLRDLESDRISKRRAAVKALGQARGSTLAARTLAQKLDDNFLRNEVSDALKSIGAPAARFVAPYLRSDDTFVKKEAVELLKEIGTPSEIPELKAVARQGSVFEKRDANAAIRAIEIRHAQEEEE